MTCVAYYFVHPTFSWSGVRICGVVVTQADKGKILVIINLKEYSDKVHSFITANNFNTLNKDPANKFQKSIHKIVKECSSVIDKRQGQFLIQKKPSAPDLKAQLKLHKIGIPIRPVINNRTVPAYKLAKHLTKILNQHINLNNQYNITNSTKLANDLIKLPVHENYRMITFDIKDLYVNIPIDETLKIIKTKLQQNNETQTTHQIIPLLRTILSQIYFTFQQKIYQPEQCISMGSPISSLIAEIFLQNYEDKNIKQFSEAKSTIFYVRYVGDILIIFDKTKISPQNINTHINKAHINIQLNPTYEEHSSINFFDLIIRRQYKKT
jgi:hypothetical protein